MVCFFFPLFFNIFAAFLSCFKLNFILCNIFMGGGGFGFYMPLGRSSGQMREKFKNRNKSDAQYICIYKYFFRSLTTRLTLLPCCCPPNQRRFFNSFELEKKYMKRPAKNKNKWQTCFRPKGWKVAPNIQFKRQLLPQFPSLCSVNLFTSALWINFFCCGLFHLLFTLLIYNYVYINLRPGEFINLLKKKKRSCL